MLVNAVAAASQVIVTGVVYFFLYRFLLDLLGRDLFGVWALVLAASSTTAIANLGLANACIRFIPLRLAENDGSGAASIVETAALSVAVSLGVVFAIALPAISAVLPAVIADPTALQSARSILPVVLVSIWVSSVTAVFLAGLEGCQRVDLRSHILSGAIVTYLVLSIVLAKANGLLGLAMAHLIHASIALIVSWSILRRFIRELPILPFHWKRETFKSIFRYSAGMQAISVANVITEPVAKAFVSAFGGLGALALYEFGWKLSVQLRSVAAGAVQSALPAIAKLSVSDQDGVVAVYVKTQRIVTALTIVTVPTIIGLLPSVSRVWIGSHEPFFVLSATLLVVAWFVNLLATPGYFGFLGEGRLKWPLVSHGILAVGVLVVGFVAGRQFGPIGVVVAISGSLVVGSVLVARNYSRRCGVSWRTILDSPTARLVIASVGAGLGAWLLGDRNPLSMSAGVLLIGQLALIGAILLIPLLRHPLRKELIELTRHLKHRESEAP